MSTSTVSDLLWAEQILGKSKRISPDYDYAKMSASKSDKMRPPSDCLLVSTKNLSIYDTKESDPNVQKSDKKVETKTPEGSTNLGKAVPEEQVHDLVSKICRSSSVLKNNVKTFEDFQSFE